MKFLFSILFLLFLNSVFAQHKNHQQEILNFQKELNESYRNPKETPLDSVALKNFKGHPFFPIDAQYRVKAKFKRTPNQKAFEMPTSSGKTKTYEKYGELHFTLKGKKEKLNLYQSHALRQQEAYKDYLFLPFLDLTNGVSTYGAGRYLDMRIPKNNQWVIDFNKAYNPYCAYSPNYNCPIVPMENFLDREIKAGIQYNPEK